MILAVRTIDNTTLLGLDTRLPQPRHGDEGEQDGDDGFLVHSFHFIVCKVIVILFHLQFLLSFVLCHIADHDLRAWFKAADDLDVVIVALAEADLAGQEQVVL